jgi:hypothetical protein
MGHHANHLVPKVKKEWSYAYITWARLIAQVLYVLMYVRVPIHPVLHETAPFLQPVSPQMMGRKYVPPPLYLQEICG